MPDSHACRHGSRLACCKGSLTVPSLRQLLSVHPVLLGLDTSSTQVEVALWISPSTEPAHRVTLEGEASAALPLAIGQVLAAAGREVRDLAAAAFCSGPGSVLGIRLAAATLRAWRAVRPELPLYSYLSLPALASAHPDFTVIADARRDTWHAVLPGANRAVIRLATAELAAHAPLATPAQFRRWSVLPANPPVTALPWSAAGSLAASPDADFFAEATAPDVFQHEAPSYAAWTPHIHRAPSAP